MPFLRHTAALGTHPARHLRLREQVRTGAVIGPWVVVGSPQLPGRAFGEPRFDGYLKAAVGDSAPNRRLVSGPDVWRPASWASLDYMDLAKLAAGAGRTAAPAAWRRIRPPHSPS